jgi:hypothetical protein
MTIVIPTVAWFQLPLPLPRLSDLHLSIQLFFPKTDWAFAIAALGTKWAE